MNVLCPHCKQSHEFNHQTVGQTAQCQACGKDFTIEQDVAHSTQTTSPMPPPSPGVQIEITNQEGVLRLLGDYASAFQALHEVMLSLGGTIEQSDMNTGTLQAGWSGSAMYWGLWVLGTFRSQQGGVVQLAITGGTKGSLDTTGAGRKKVQEVTNAYLYRFGIVNNGFPTASIVNMPQSAFMPPPSSPQDIPHRGKSKTTAGLCGLLLGGLGLHKFYLGGWAWGIIYLILCWTWVPAIIGLIEGIQYLTMSQQSFDAKYNFSPPKALKW